jgi:hypothetical protein
MFTSTVILIIFLAGFVFLLVAFIPTDIWKSLPIWGILSGIIINGVISLFLYVAFQYAGESEKVLGTIIIPLILSMIVLWFFGTSSVNIQDFTLGFISPLLLVFIGSIPAVIYFMLTGYIRGTSEIVGAFGMGIGFIIGFFIIYGIFYSWFNIYNNMNYKFENSQIIFVNLGISLVGIAIGIIIGGLNW